MKKITKRLSALALAVVLLMSLSVAALADGTVTYEGDAERFVFVGDATGNLFGGFNGVMPGDTITQTVRIAIEPKANMTTTIAMRAETPDTAPAGENAVTMADFLSQLTMTVRQGDRILSQTSPDQPGGLATGITLLQATEATDTTLTVELSVPIELGNEYANRVGYVNWVFTADEVPIVTPADETPEDEDAVSLEDLDENGVPRANGEGEDIGDDAIPRAGALFGEDGKSWALVNLLCAIATVALGGVMLVTFLRKRKEEQNEDEKSDELKAAAAEAEEKEEEPEAKRRKVKLFGLIPAVASVVAFLLTEDMRLPMAWLDRWTILMAVILAVNVVLMIVTRNKKKDHDDNEPEDTNAVPVSA